MQLQLKQSHDKRKFPYYVTTKNFKYYFSRKADASKMFERRVRVLRYVFAACIQDINRVTMKYSKYSCKDINVQRSFSLAQNMILQLSQYSDVPDYENKVHTLLTSLISVTGTIGMKSYNKKLISMRVNTFDTPVIPYALSPYFVEIIN
jgi:hypothetical protein